MMAHTNIVKLHRELNSRDTFSYPMIMTENTLPRVKSVMDDLESTASTRSRSVPSHFLNSFCQFYIRQKIDQRDVQ